MQMHDEPGPTVEKVQRATRQDVRDKLSGAEVKARSQYAFTHWQGHKYEQCRRTRVGGRGKGVTGHGQYMGFFSRVSRWPSLSETAFWAAQRADSQTIRCVRKG